jgi:hypothetical protein
VLLWTCDPPAVGATVVVPTTVLLDDRDIPMYGMVKGITGRDPLCTSNTTDPVSNLCEIDGIHSDCYPEPHAGQIVVTAWPHAGAHPSGCSGLCRTY